MTRALFVATLILIGACWGVTQSLGKIAVSTGHAQFGLIFWQTVIASLLLGAVMLLRRKTVPINRATLRFAGVVAVIGTLIPNGAFYVSIVHLPAGLMSILISTTPLLAFPIALAVGIDRFSMARMAGLVAGLAGVTLIALPEVSLPASAVLAYLPLAMIGPLFYAFEANYVASRGTAGMDAVQAMFLASVVGACLTLPLALGTGQFFNLAADFGRPELALVLLSAAHALAYSGYVWLASNAGAVFAAQCSYIVTGTGVLWSMLLLGERFSGWIWAALGCMMVGLMLVQPRPREALASLAHAGDIAPPHHRTSDE